MDKIRVLNSNNNNKLIKSISKFLIINIKINKKKIKFNKNSI